MENSKEFGKDFLLDYEKFIKEFDEIAKDLFQGYKLEELSKEFLNNHKKELELIPFAAIDSKYPNCSNNETIREDLVIINNENEIKNASKENKILANLFRRFCQATHLRITYNKSRFDQEDDRTESLVWARYAIRHNPDDSFSCLSFLYSLGWLTDSIRSIKEKTVVGRLYHDSCRRCIRLSPKDCSAHNLLGRYYYHAAQLTWIEKKIVKTFLGDNLSGTYLDAQKCFETSNQLLEWMPNYLWLARVLVAQNKPYGDVKKMINSGLKMDCYEPTSEIEKRELIELDLKLKQNDNN